MIAANPILARELKERMRALRAPVVLSVYLLFLGIIVFSIEHTAARDLQFAALTSAAAGRIVFHWLLFFLLVFVLLMVPAISAGAISSERERETLHLVQVTALSPHRIVRGKLAASMAWILLLVIATLPLVSVSFVLGGVTVADVALGYLMTLVTAVTIAVVTIGISSRMRRTMGATVLSLLFMASLTVGTGIAFGLVTAWENRVVGFRPDRSPPVWTLIPNPVIGTASVIQGSDNGGGDTPFSAIFALLHAARNSLGYISFGPSGPSPVRPAAGGPPLWTWHLVSDAIVIALGYGLAVGGVRAPRDVFRSGRRRRKGEVA